MRRRRAPERLTLTRKALARAKAIALLITSAEARAFRIKHERNCQWTCCLTCRPSGNALGGLIPTFSL
jgi:hypothetical protein